MAMRPKTTEPAGDRLRSLAATAPGPEARLRLAVIPIAEAEGFRLFCTGDELSPADPQVLQGQADRAEQRRILRGSPIRFREAGFLWRLGRTAGAGERRRRQEALERGCGGLLRIEPPMVRIDTHILTGFWRDPASGPTAPSFNPALADHLFAGFGRLLPQVSGQRGRR
jgi:hypothetical protein